MLDRWISRHWMVFSLSILTLAAAWVWVSRPAILPTSAVEPAPQQGFMAPGFHFEHFWWRAGQSGRAQRQGGSDQFLGKLVPTLPGRDAGHAERLRR